VIPPPSHLHLYLPWHKWNINGSHPFLFSFSPPFFFFFSLTRFTCFFKARPPQFSPPTFHLFWVQITHVSVQSTSPERPFLDPHLKGPIPLVKFTDSLWRQYVVVFCCFVFLSSLPYLSFLVPVVFCSANPASPSGRYFGNLTLVFLPDFSFDFFFFNHFPRTFWSPLPCYNTAPFLVRCFYTNLFYVSWQRMDCLEILGFLISHPLGTKIFSVTFFSLVHPRVFFFPPWVSSSSEKDRSNDSTPLFIINPLLFPPISFTNFLSAFFVGISVLSVFLLQFFFPSYLDLVCLGP